MTEREFYQQFSVAEPDEEPEPEQVDVVEEEGEEEDIEDPIGEVVLDEEEEEK